ncbi:MAG: hypothetical protein KTR21_03990 [Rhodobacteraceae bacterium]|nr:hypothetical protein [Paracoccaceae bacterium]
MKQRLALAAPLFALLLAAPSLAEDRADPRPWEPWDPSAPMIRGLEKDWPDCQCRAPGGEMMALGSMLTITESGGDVCLRCDMSLNTPIWRRQSGACAPTS